MRKHKKHLQESVADVSLNVGIVEVAKLLGRSVSTVRRLKDGDPTFPKPFRLTEGGDWAWLRRDVIEWNEARAARAKAA